MTPTKDAERKMRLRYIDRRRFPESNSPILQMVLMLKGFKPLLRQKRQRVSHKIKSAFARLQALLWSRRKNVPSWPLRVALLIVGPLIVAIWAFQLLYTNATTVFFDGVELGTVATEEEARAARSSVEASVSQALGYDFTLEDDKVVYTTHLTYRSALVDEAEIEEALTDNLEETIGDLLPATAHGYALYVDGVFIGATQTQGAMEELLTQVSAAYRNENTISVDFVESVDIRECTLPVEEFTNLADVALLLNSTKAGEVTYTVRQGDCWSLIAQDHNLTSKQLLALNPGYDIDRINVGDVLLISNAVPYLTVIATQMEYYLAEVPYEIEYVDDPSMWVGDTRVISKGAFGSADTVARVTYRGREEQERIIESQTILVEPVTEVQARGTTPRPSWAPTGTFRWPTSGTVTSKYGYRDIFGGTSVHGGWDIANKKGTDVVAADGGKVVYAGWMSGYGYLIEIDHTNGYTTYYGHNSELLVSVGDKVYKGQHIAEMGATGRVTGTHCHFEIRYNGERQNPSDYLS